MTDLAQVKRFLERAKRLVRQAEILSGREYATLSAELDRVIPHLEPTIRLPQIGRLIKDYKKQNGKLPNIETILRWEPKYPELMDMYSKTNETTRRAVAEAMAKLGF